MPLHSLDLSVPCQVFQKTDPNTEFKNDANMYYGWTRYTDVGKEGGKERHKHAHMHAHTCTDTHAHTMSLVALMQTLVQSVHRQQSWWLGHALVSV